MTARAQAKKRRALPTNTRSLALRARDTSRRDAPAATIQRTDMNNKKAWHTDVEELLEQSVHAEVNTKVWDAFGTATENLDKESADLFSEFLNGTSAPKLAIQRKLSVEEVEAWLARIKREVMHELRLKFKVRQ